jgi:hypothetical protein
VFWVDFPGYFTYTCINKKEMKTGKELKIKKYKNYNVVFGSVNNKTSKAVYINISSWAEPLIESDVNYTRVIKDLNKKIKQIIFNHLSSRANNNFIKNNTIVDFDIRESGIRFGKRSFINCEITLYLDQEISINSEEMRFDLDEITNILIKNVYENDKTFKFHSKKNLI